MRVSQKAIALVMAFGAGVLLSAVSFELVGEAYEQGGLGPAAIGTLAGAVAYTAGNLRLARRGARHRNLAIGLVTVSGFLVSFALSHA